jgi:hypothetical protein
LINNFTFGLQKLIFEEAWQADFETLWNGIDSYKILNELVGNNFSTISFDINVINFC